jgi:hypothetical protein
MAETVSPTLDQVLDFCAEEPVERVFLEDIARRGSAASPLSPAPEGDSTRSAMSAPTSSPRAVGARRLPRWRRAAAPAW